MNELIRENIEPFFSKLFNKIIELDKKIDLLGKKITKIEQDILEVNIKLDNNTNECYNLHT
jgi:hypothetical protein